MINKKTTMNKTQREDSNFLANGFFITTIILLLIVGILGLKVMGRDEQINSLEQSNNKLQASLDRCEDKPEKPEYSYEWTCTETAKCLDGREIPNEVVLKWSKPTHSPQEEGQLYWGGTKSLLVWNEESGRYSMCDYVISDCFISDVNLREQPQ